MFGLRDKILLPFVVIGVIIAIFVIYENYDFTETNREKIKNNSTLQQEALDIGWDSLIESSEGYVARVEYHEEKPNEVRIHVSKEWDSMPIHAKEMALGQLTNTAHGVLYSATFAEKDEVVKVIFHHSNGSEMETKYSYYTTIEEK